MRNTSNGNLKVEILDVVDHIRATDGDVDSIEMKICSDEKSFKRQKRIEKSYGAKRKFGIRAIFLPGYNSDFDIRMKIITYGKVCGERLIEHSRIHAVEGHTVLIESETSNPRTDSQFPKLDRGISNSPAPNERSELHESAITGTIEVMFEDVKDLQYYSTPKEQTFQRREKMASKAERMVGGEAKAIRVPLERLVDCGHASMSWDYVHEDRHLIARFWL